MKVLITGVAGFLGSHLADAFLTAGHGVVGNDSLIGGYLDNVPKGVEFHRVDCNNLSTMRLLMRGVDVVYALACTAHEGLSVFSPHENAMNGFAAALATFSAACSAGVRRIIMASSMARYGAQDKTPFTEDMICKPCDPYGWGKFGAEEVLRVLANTHGLEYVVLNPHNIYGERQAIDPYRNVTAIFMNLMLQGRQPYIYGDGQQERCFSYYTDCVEPMVKAATAPVSGEVINIGPDDEVITVLRLAEMIAEIIGFKLDPIFLPDRPCEVKVAHCSAEKARRLLGYEPKVPLIDGLRAMLAWLEKRGPRPFNYHLGLEIETARTPRTWAERLF